MICRTNPSTARFAFALLALAGAATSAHAQPNVYRLGIPDLDQRRDGLAGNGGMHCVPTSCMNLYAYAANHGIPLATSPFSGPRNWQLPANYDEGTTLINTLGSFMGTTAADGTFTTPAKNGLILWNATHGFAFTADTYGVNQFGLGPTPAQVGSNMLLGGLVAVCYGRYVQQGNGTWTRNGGHCMTLSAVQNGDFLVRDPASDEGDVFGRLTNQSPFTSERYTMNPVAVVCNTDSGQQFRVLHHFVEKGEGRFLDRVFVLWPHLAITPVMIGTIPHVKFITPLSLLNEALDPETVVPVPGVMEINDVAIGLNKTHTYLAAHTSRTSGGLFKHDRVTNAVTPIVPLTDPGKLVVDRFGRIWACDGSVLKIIPNPDDPAPSVQTIVLPTSSTPDDIFFDDATDEMHILSTTNDRLIIAIADGSVRANLRLPTGVDLQGDGSVCPSPDGTQIFLAHQGDGSVRVCVPAAGAPVLNLVRTFSLPGVQSIRSMQLDDRGHLFISNGTEMHEFAEESPGGRWLAVPNSMWSGRLASGALNFGRSRTNFTPGQEPGDVNILNGEPGGGFEIPDCPIDFNLDAEVNADDLADYINAYFDPANQRGARFPDRRVDFNQDGELNADDLADYINEYFGRGC